MPGTDQPITRTIRFESGASAMAAVSGFSGSSVEGIEGADPRGDGRVEVNVDGIRVLVEADEAAARVAVSRSGQPEAALAALDRVAEALADPERATAEHNLAPSSSDRDRAAALHAAVAAGADRDADLRLAARCIDLTTLEGDDTPGRVRWLCAQAIQPDPTDPTVGPTAAVCVYPAFVALARELTEGTAVRVASVAGAFPSGHSSLPVRLADIADALADGAHEIDIVLNRTAFLTGDHALAVEEIRRSRAAAGDAHLKVIIEVGDLGSDAAIRAATRLAIDGGADTVKTSTGKTPRNATPAAVLAMADVIADHAEQSGDRIGLKVSGGVRTPADALGYLALVRYRLGDDWLTPDRFRFGASGLLGNVVAALSQGSA